VRLHLGFDVQAPIDAVWPALNDLESVAPCLPGATLSGHEDGTYHGEFTLRVGPFATVHRGTIRIEAADAAARVQRLAVTGSSAYGATIVNTFSETADGTHVDAVAELTVAGPLAAFVGSGVIEDVSNRLLRDFATCLAGRLNAPAAPTGAEVTTGEAAPEELLAATPEDLPDPDSTGG
jgi:carbon monoxide dehydrogenase subunit G